MLSIRNAEPTDFEALSNYFKKENLEGFHPDLKETMLLVDDETILGFATASLIGGKPTLDGIYIPEKLRGHLLGDAVLRGLLFYFMNRGFEQAYAIEDARTDAFYEHLGFAKEDEGYSVVLNDFFDRKCRGCKDSHE